MPIPYGRRLSLRNDKLQDVTPVRPEGDAQADLLHPTFYRVGEHAVTADRAEDESKQTEGGETLHVGALPGEGLVHELFACQGAVDRDIFVDLVDCVGLARLYLQRPSRGTFK
jgi:hypothetical protein